MATDQARDLDRKARNEGRKRLKTHETFFPSDPGMVMLALEERYLNWRRGCSGQSSIRQIDGVERESSPSVHPGAKLS
jgi:hypothetical protein